MKLGILFSGGKDSCYAAYLAKKQGYEISCLISIFSENKESFMFHTPSIDKVKKQAEVMKIPLIIQKTKGEKEKELGDLKNAIKKAIEEYKIEGIVSGAVESAYQASRIQKICNDLRIECFNPLWQKDQMELLNELVENKFKVIIIGVAAEGLDQSWLGRKLDNLMIKELQELHTKFGLSPSFEGGEAETFVLECPLFKKRLGIRTFEKIMDTKNSGRMEILEVDFIC
jgi:diphthine-ammonia ligase